MSRGNRREDIFLDDVDRQDFIKTLAEACRKRGWQVRAHCLMSNHYHLVLETPDANLVAGMAWLQSSYTIRLNHRDNRLNRRLVTIAYQQGAQPSGSYSQAAGGHRHDLKGYYRLFNSKQEEM